MPLTASWTPKPLVDWFNLYIEDQRTHGPIYTGDDVPDFDAMWSRLLSRSEMEAIWGFVDDADSVIKLDSNGGLAATLNRDVIAYCGARKATPANYKQELLDIAKLADNLARKLKNFSSAGSGLHNPFPLRALLTSEQEEFASHMLRDEFRRKTSLGQSMTATVLEHYIPAPDSLLETIAVHARREAEDQYARLRLPTKVNGANAFRTYFARRVADWFLISRSDYSPTRIATFCSVALDDPDLSPDLIRKLCPLEDEMRALLEHIAYCRDNPED